MEQNSFESIRGHEVIVEQIWGDGTRVFHRGFVKEVVGSLIYIINSDLNHDPSPAWAKIIANRKPTGIDEDQADARQPTAEFSDLWLNLASIGVMSFVDVTATRSQSKLRLQREKN